jgi:hypothetical protein
MRIPPAAIIGTLEAIFKGWLVISPVIIVITVILFGSAVKDW